MPQLKLAESIAVFLGTIDFNETLMHGMLSFLLFAGALHIDLEGLLANKWTIGVLATIGVILSTAIVGLLTWWTFPLLGISPPLLVCLTFGALISPTADCGRVALQRRYRSRGVPCHGVSRRVVRVRGAGGRHRCRCPADVLRP